MSSEFINRISQDEKSGMGPASSHGWEYNNMDGGALKVKGEAEAIFFDAAGTLIRLERPVGWHYAEVARRHGLNADEQRMESAFREVWKARPFRPASPGPREEDDRPWWRALALDVLRTGAVSAAKIDEEAWFEELYAHFGKPGVWVLYDDSRRCLGRLASRFRLAVVSNFDRRLRLILEDLGVASKFEHIFISSEVGCEKPHPGIFRQALDVMDVEAGRCLHVGDDPERDWAGAAAAGIEVFGVRRPEVTLDDLPVYPVPK
jgi:putative hydrolase of the HAD superfamily